MMKIYTYERKFYFIEVIVTGIFSLFIFFVSLFLLLKGVATLLMLVVAAVTFYTVWNTFISRSTPEQVMVDDQRLIFSSFKKKEHYLLSETQRIRIREFPTSGKMYIRINNSNPLKGRYWIQTAKFENGKELFKKLLDIEYEKHPDTLKARARTVNTKYIELAKQKQKRTKKRILMK